MLFNEIDEFLKESSEKSDFKINIEENGGHIVFSNSSKGGERKFFTISLIAIKSMLEDISNNFSKFESHTNYVEKDWRDLSQYYTDETIKSMATVQTKSLFITVSKIINWANYDESNFDEKIINLSPDILANTIEKLDILIKYFSPKTIEDNEELFKTWLKNNVNSPTPLSTYPLALKETIPQYLSALGEEKYKNLFECYDIDYLEKLYKRLLKNGDLHDFSIDTKAQTPSASVGKYIKFLKENYDIDTFNDEDKSQIKSEERIVKTKDKGIFINQSQGNLTFPHKNLLLKGVPGTGKSHTIEKIINDNLKLDNMLENICRINIHSASSNADLMQGIGISSTNGDIEYKEKQGLIYNHIKKALFTPNQPFVLVLEEIQENSLNELIGDLIYLIEDKKRVTVDASKFEDGREYEYQVFIEKVLKDENNEYYIEIPYLVDTSTNYRKMVLPSNLYIFCTSNYRDDKKVIEDNLLRRFDVVEIYPKYEKIYQSEDISQFLELLNNKILEKFKDEIHPDRYLIGHSNWLEITDDDNDENKKLFYTALLKVIIEFKEIREVDFDTYTKEILEKILKDDTLSDLIKKYIEDCGFEYTSYKEMVEKLQREIYSFVK